MGPTEALARFAIEMDGKGLPAEVVHTARRAIMDCIGVGLAGSPDPACQLIADGVRSEGGTPECSVWGHNWRANARGAALINGAAAHVLDYDDHAQVLGHAASPVLPALLAAGERMGASGAAVLAAFVVAVEVECKLGVSVGPDAFDKGWHTTNTMGVVGAAAGVGRLLGLDLPAMRYALGIAAARACGLRQSHGSMTKSLQVGWSNESAIQAAELAARGFTASETIIEGACGYWDVFGGPANRDGGALWEGLGHPYYLVEPGLNFKAYPCCAATHCSIDAAIQVSEGLVTNDVESVLVEVPYRVPEVLLHHRPTTGLTGKFSLEYCVAAALLEGKVTRSHFTDAVVSTPQYQSLLRRVSHRVPEEWQKGKVEAPERRARVEVRLKDGTLRQGYTDFPRGHARKPMSDGELEAKFLDCATIAMDGAQARELLELVRAFDRLADVRALTERLTLRASGE